MTWTDISSEKIYRWPARTWQDAQHHQSLEKCRSKPQWDTISHPLGWPPWRRKKMQKMTSVGENVEKLEPSGTSGGRVKWCRHCKSAWRFPKEVNRELAHDPANSSSESTRKTWKQRTRQTHVHQCSQHTVRNSRKARQPRCPPTGEGIRKMWYRHKMACYLALKRKEILKYTAIWTNLEDMLSQTQKGN